MKCINCGEPILVQECRGRKNGCCNCIGHEVQPCCLPRKVIRIKGLIREDGVIVTTKYVIPVLLDVKDVNW